MSDQKPYLSDDGNTLWLPYSMPDLLSAIDRTEQAPAPEPPPGYTLSPGDYPAVALADLSAGDTLWLAHGAHPYPIHLPKAINLRALPGAAPVMSGWKLVSWEWVGRDGGFDTCRTVYDRGAWGLNHRISNNAAFPSGRQAVHNLCAMPEYAMLDGVAVSCTYDEKSGYLYASIPDGSDATNLVVAAYPQLLTAADGVNGVTIEGVTFEGAANTTKQGAVQVYGEGWVLDRVTVRDVNSVGIMVGGIGHRFIDCWADDCGQMGWAGKIDGGVFESCGMRRANWKGFDAGWEAGMKFSYSRGNTWTNWTAEDCDAPGFWLDISNYDNTLDGFRIERCMKAGAMLEHHASGNTYRNGTIYGTRAWPVTGACAGLQVQSNCNGNEFDGITIDRTESGNGMVYKAKEGRGPSSKNRFANITADRAWRIEGALSGDDTFINCDPMP